MNIILMGVSGSGKTTLANRVAEIIQCGPVIEADSLHSPEMKNKMRSGTPLSDEDRWPWLTRVADAINTSKLPLCIATCSALKRIYRDHLRRTIHGDVSFILLHAPKEILLQRLTSRQHEYMPTTLLDSQLATLELPAQDEKIHSLSVACEENETLRELQRIITELLNQK